MADTNVPITFGAAAKSGKDSEVWLRISAFLSLKSETTRITYLGIIKEWCGFLGAEAGSAQAARKIVSASDMHAIAFRNWLESQPGEVPRQERNRRSKIRAVELRSGKPSRKKTGLESTLSNATIAKKFAVLRRIYKVLQSSDLGLKLNPFDSDRVPPPPKEAGRKRPTEILEFNKVTKLIQMVDDSTPKGLRDKAVLCLLFGGALRRSEVANLRVSDVRKSPAGTVFVYLRSTKAKKDAQQALPKWAAQVIRKLADARLKNGATATDYLILGFTGKGGLVPSSSRISESSIYNLFKDCCTRAGVQGVLTPHSARATAITKLLSDGIPHRQVQEFSRHSSIQMVELYDKRRIGVDENPAKDLEY